MATGRKTPDYSRPVEMKIEALFLTALFTLLLFTHGWGKELNDEQRAATLFHDQQYEQALSIWKPMTRQLQDANLYYNIGLTEARLGHVYESIYAFEQALRIKPSCHQFQLALAAERKQMESPTIPITPFFLTRWYLGWVSLLRPGVWAFTGLLLLVFTLLLYLMKAGAIRLTLRFNQLLISGLCAAGILFCLTAWLSYLHLYSKKEAIVRDNCELKQASSSDSPKLRMLAPGEKIRIKDQIDDWYYVELINLDFGWINKNCFEALTLNDQSN